MAGITLEFAQSRLDAYLAAEEAALAGKSYTFTGPDGGRTVTRQDLSYIRDGIATWSARVERLSRGGGMRMRFAETWY